MIGLRFGGPSAVSPAPGARMRAWRESMWAARDRLLGRPGFQRWAASFPLTRPIANRQARALFDLCAGFVYSQVLLACVQVDLFDKLAGGTRRVEDIANLCALSPDAATRLLEAAATLRLVARRGKGRYGLGMLGAALRANPAIAALVRHHRLLYADLADPLALLRGTGGRPQLADYWPYATAANAAGLDAAAIADYTALMGASQAMIANHVLDAYDVTRHRRLLDVGGGDGSFLTAVARARAKPRSRLVRIFRPSRRWHARDCGPPATRRGRRSSRATSVPMRCRRAPISSRSSVCSTIRTTRAPSRCCAPFERHVRRAGPC